MCSSDLIYTSIYNEDGRIDVFSMDGKKVKSCVVSDIDGIRSCGQETLVYQNGCLTCVSCGYSKCG